MQKLVDGLHKFREEIWKPKRELFERLATGQKPEVLFITCSDSRVNPNLLTQTEPGDLFILRNAGNLVPPHGASNGGEAATIEYAVSALRVSHIVVCGHLSCGAMHGLLNPDTVADLPAVQSWLRHADTTRKLIDENYQHLEGEDLLGATVAENVLVQLEHLRTHPAVSARLSRGELSLHGWVYKIQTGQVFGFDQQEGQFRPVVHAATPPAPAPARRLTAL